jgi:hypothetical protein
LIGSAIAEPAFLFIDHESKWGKTAKILLKEKAHRNNELIMVKYFVNWKILAHG